MQVMLNDHLNLFYLEKNQESFKKIKLDYNETMHLPAKMIKLFLLQSV